MTGYENDESPPVKCYSHHMEFKPGKDCTIPIRHNRWPSIIFLGGISLIALLGCPAYWFFHGVATPTIVLSVIMMVGCTLAITSGYHRLYAHSAYKANSIYQFIMLALGAATFQQSALKWASLHRTHHQFTDTPRDPYNIKMGFFYAHMGWIMFWLRGIDYENVKDLKKMPLIMRQHNHFQLWALGFGVLMPVLIGAMYGHMFEALLFGVVGRMFVVFQITFFINSFAHTFGAATYDKKISARDNWLGAILTGGEGYHSFHHRFPTDYRNGVRWYHWDPSKWLIWLSSHLGWAWDLKRTPGIQILKARA
jgi:stearoyl-CoA desaturase (Delta-9 desaturase)